MCRLSLNSGLRTHNIPANPAIGEFHPAEKSHVCLCRADYMGPKCALAALNDNVAYVVAYALDSPVNARDFMDGQGALFPGASLQQRKKATAQKGLELPDHVCGSLKKLASELQLNIPVALSEINNATAGPGQTRSW